MGEKLKKIFAALSRNERIAVLAAGLICTISGAILIGIFVQHSTIIVPAKGGDYTEGLVGQPVSINPITATSESDQALVRLLFARLDDVAQKTEWVTDKDNRIVRIRLKENLLWSDGQKLTSDDVIFTIQKIQDPKSQSPLFARWQGVVPQRLSELELQLTLASPYVFFSDTLRALFIAPKHLFSDIPVQNWHLSQYNLQPAASGPYEIDAQSTQPDGFITSYHLRPNPNYAGTAPFITNFNVQFFSTMDDALTSFNGGKIDGLGGIDVQKLQTIQRPHKELFFTLPQYYAVFFNQSKNLALQDDAVRKALALATDKEALVRDVLGGHGHTMTGPIPQDALFFDQNLGTETYAADVASTTLDKAGWKVNSSGVREKKDKKNTIPLEVTLTVPQIQFLKDTAERLKASWERVGFKVNLNYKSVQEVTETTIKDRSHEALLFGNLLGPSSDLLSFWHSSERFSPGRNLSLFADKKADSLIEGIRQNFDEGSRQKQFNQLQELIASEHPAIFLYSPNYLYVTIKNLEGVPQQTISEPVERLAGVTGWYLRTARVLK